MRIKRWIILRWYLIKRITSYTCPLITVPAYRFSFVFIQGSPVIQSEFLLLMTSVQTRGAWLWGNLKMSLQKVLVLLRFLSCWVWGYGITVLICCSFNVYFIVKYWCHGCFTTVRTLAINRLIKILINGEPDYSNRCVRAIINLFGNYSYCDDILMHSVNKLSIIKLIKNGWTLSSMKLNTV